MKNEVIGYNCNYIFTLYEIIDKYILENLYYKDYKNIGITKFMGIKPEYRNQGLADDLMTYGVNELFNECAEALFATLKRKQNTPIKGVFDSIGFEYVCDMKHPWYDLRGMKCTYCKQEHCICDAAVYIKTKANG